jgi:hypothetical protein
MIGAKSLLHIQHAQGMKATINDRLQDVEDEEEDEEEEDDESDEEETGEGGGDGTEFTGSFQSKIIVGQETATITQ